MASVLVRGIDGNDVSVPEKEFKEARAFFKKYDIGLTETNQFLIDQYRSKGKPC